MRLWHPALASLLVLLGGSPAVRAGTATLTSRSGAAVYELRLNAVSLPADTSQVAVKAELRRDGEFLSAPTLVFPHGERATATTRGAYGELTVTGYSAAGAGTVRIEGTLRKDGAVVFAPATELSLSAP